ncbi:MULTISPECIES: hypothetical protein [unclassified Thiomonas]|jgi:hypothetical protein|nr:MULTISPECIES: hypothetical protein [unclassified Thiomonas]
MLYIAAIAAIYLVTMLTVMHFSIAAGLVLLAMGLIAGGSAAASLAG